MENFNLVILEILPDLDAKILLEREQYWINLLKPIYNILTIAGNSLGFKHTEETKELMRLKALGRKHTDEVKNLMSESRKGENSVWYGKKLSEETKLKISIVASNRTKDSNPGFKLEILDLELSKTFIFKSIREASRELNVSYARLAILKIKKINRIKKDI